MNKDDYRRKNSFIEHLITTATHYGKEVTYSQAVWLAEDIHKKEATLSRLAEDECNYPTYDEKKQERYEELITERINTIIGCPVETGRDPRGYCIKLHLVDEDGRRWATNWDGETASTNW